VAALPRRSAEQLSSLRLQLEFMILFEHGTSDMLVQWVYRKPREFQCKMAVHL